MEALGRGDSERALRHLDEAEQRYPVLQDYALYFQARAAGGRDEAERALGRLLELHPESVWAGAAHLFIGKLRRAAGDLAGARAAFREARLTLRHGSDEWARATAALARVEYESQDGMAALALVREVRLANPEQPAARRARRLADRIRREHPDLIPWSAADEAEMSLREGDAARALAATEVALGADTDAAERGRALWTRAHAERALGRTPAAEATCLALAREMPDDPHAPGALLEAGRWRWNADDDSGALELFGRVTTRYPTSQEAAEALYGSGRIHQEAGREREAWESYAQLAERFPRSPHAPEARWRQGWVRYLGGEFGLAARSFRVAEKRSSVRDAAWYWEARALERLGRRAEAEALLRQLVERRPTSYYAGLAEERLGQEALPPAAPVAPIPALFPPDLSGGHAERGRLLSSLGFPHFARLEVDALRDEGAPPARVLEAYSAIGAPSAALRLAATMSTESLPSREQYLYPLGFWDHVSRAAEVHDLDPLLVLALIRQESLFDPEAVSPANAHGLMQLLPSTAAQVSERSGASPPDAEALQDPATNIRLGVALLARLLRRYDGAEIKALAAYNAGEDAVAKWEQRYGARPPDEFVELISYRETRHYVKKVLGNYRTYRQLYAPSPAATKAGSPPNAPFDMMTMTSPSLADPTR